MTATSVRALMLAFALLAMSGCNHVEPKTMDTMKPHVEWRILDMETNALTTHPAMTTNPPVQLTQGHEYMVVLAGTDPGGMGYISLVGSTSFRCQQGDIASAGQTDEILRDYTYTKDSNGQVNSEATMVDFFEASWACQRGWSLSWGRELTGQVKDYAGNYVPAQLEMTI